MGSESLIFDSDTTDSLTSYSGKAPALAAVFV
jgi:hypothetical protein